MQDEPPVFAVLVTVIPLPISFLPSQCRLCQAGNIPALFPPSPSSPQIFFFPISQPCPTFSFLMKCLKAGKIPNPHPWHTDLAASACPLDSLWLAPAQPCWHRCQDLGTRTTTDIWNTGQGQCDPTGMLQCRTPCGSDILPGSLCPSHLPVTAQRHFWPLGKLQEII